MQLLVKKRLTRFFVFASLLLTSQSPLASGRIGHVLVSLWLGPCRLQKSGNQMYDVGYWSRYAQKIVTSKNYSFIAFPDACDSTQVYAYHSFLTELLATAQ